MSGAELAKRATISELARAYAEARQGFLLGFEALLGAKRAWDAVFTLKGTDKLYIKMSDHCHHFLSEEDPEVAARPALAYLRVSTWENLGERLGLQAVMSAARWKEFSEDVKRDRMPEPTEETIQQFVAGHLGALDLAFGEKVREVFEWLRPRHPAGVAYKRNSQYEAPRNFAITNCLERWDVWSSKHSIDFDRRSNFLALESVVRRLDGRADVANDSNRSDIENLVATLTPTNRRGETEYFEVTAHKNRSLHMTWRRGDLLAKFNKLAGGARLRGEPGR